LVAHPKSTEAVLLNAFLFRYRQRISAGPGPL